ncbi:sugar ABC transporter ATP-binding protein [Bacteroidota bacterium]
MNTQIILNMDNITKEFPGVVALNSVSLEVAKGEVHVLLGENGAGKSTLVKILSGAYKKDKGEIYLYGENIEIKSPRHAQELGIGVIYQEFNLIPRLTVAENIFLGREFTLAFGMLDNKGISIAAQSILSDLNVDIDADSLVSDLGIAEQQIVEIARALSLNSKLLIMDEPTSALTEKEIDQLFITIKKLQRSEVSIIYISHYLEEIFRIADSVTVLRDGDLIANKNIGDTDKAELIRLMVNRELQDQYPRKNKKNDNELLRVENLSIEGSLENISFKLNSGEILGIYGLLGSGRTELARVIFGLDQTDHGEIFVRNENVKHNSPREAIKKGIGFLTEDRKTQGLVLGHSVKDNICLASLDQLSNFGFINCSMEEEVTVKQISDLNIKTTGINQSVRNLSGGNQQKVVLGKWLNSKVEIYIFDEPTRGIDVGAKLEIYELMNKLTDEGCGIIMISSELPEILGMSDRILVMHNGKISAEYSSSEISQEKIMQAALGEVYAN